MQKQVCTYTPGSIWQLHKEKILILIDAGNSIWQAMIRAKKTVLHMHSRITKPLVAHGFAQQFNNDKG